MVQKNSLKKPKIIAIMGPTASGKTALAIKLAKEINGEIVSADSMQVYKNLDIGTAKITEKEMAGVKHYLLDVANFNDRFTVSNWKDLAETAIQTILSCGKTPIIVGGTGLYISSLIYGYNFYNAEENFEIRKKYEKILEEKGAENLYNILKEQSPILAEKVDKNKTRQVIRYLEISENCCNKENFMQEEPYNYLLLGLDIPRDTLYNRINKRVDIMANNGLLNEVRSLINLGFDRSSQAAQAIGYKEIFEFLDGNISEYQAYENIKQHTRNYAKRQLTWMRKMKNLIWVDPFNYENIKNLVENFIMEEK